MSSNTIGPGTSPPSAQAASPPPKAPHLPGDIAPGGGQPVRSPTTEAKASALKAATAPRAEEVKKAMERITDFVKYTASDIQFSVDKDTDALVVKVIDRDSKEVLRQIPSEEVLQIAKTLDSLQGLFVSQKV